MIAHSVVAAVSDRGRRSEIDATIYVALYNRSGRPKNDCAPSSGSHGKTNFSLSHLKLRHYREMRIRESQP